MVYQVIRKVMLLEVFLMFVSLAISWVKKPLKDHSTNLHYKKVDDVPPEEDDTLTRDIFQIFTNHCIAVSFAFYSPFGYAIAFAWIQFVCYLLYLFGIWKEHPKVKFGAYISMAICNIILFIGGLAGV